MASGVKLVNSYEKGARSDNQAVNPISAYKQNVREYLKDKKLRSAPTGTSFDYNGAQTALLGLMLRERIGTSLTEYLENKLWKPMGAQSDAYWLTNRYGEEGVQGHFAATLRDYGRLGYLLLKNGMIDGNQIIPKSWIAEMTSLQRDKPQPQKGPPFYGLHIWLLNAPVKHISLQGTNGQRIHIIPTADLVIVHTGNSPKAEFDGIDHLRPLIDSIIKSMLPK
jgi:CubicO group peptidase (beta-lactamase class C family)